MRKDIDAAIDFLDGKNQSVIDTFVARMERLRMRRSMSSGTLSRSDCAFERG